MNRNEWKKHVNYLNELNSNADGLIRVNNDLLGKWNESSDKLHHLKANQIDRNRCTNVNEYMKK